ncbi:MAG: hypothetical protein HND44_04835 [Chloroflexi bacterium]|nr:hypothetical protein [Ardenticatenaceae bacterium]MBL1127820.1 hypothetical protein [Chloroflexota bacterium]NOG33889.1 hypothetical protein [Chloroflexota bacterium]GIK54779.1 MAG: hypothetical protein BroJett015_04420 [Chloroflexota bacterium]
MFEATTRKNSVDLRPLSAGQLFDRAIRLYRQHFLTFVGIIAIAQIPITVASILLSLLAPAPEISLPTTDVFGNSPIWGFLQMTQAAGNSSTFGTVVVNILGWALALVGTAALTRAAADAYFGAPGGILDGYRRLGDVWVSLLGAVFLAVIVTILLALWTFIPLIGWFTGPGLLFFYGLVAIPFITPVIVVEGKNASSGLPRALELAQRRFWWFIGFMLLLGLFSQVIVTGPALLLAGGISAMTGEGLSPTVSAIVFQTISLLLNMIYLPIQLTCVLLIYLDVRARTEGLDLALQVTLDEENPEMVKSQLAIVGEAPAPDISFFPRRSDLGQYFLLTMAFLGIYIAIIATFILLAVLLG